jgi:pimeloyl-ACP methyl ester carboxylesterase
MHEKIVEDRVFGRPELFPPPTLSAAPSSAYDFCSVSVDGADVTYALQGTPARPPLFFIHGWGASHQFWKCQLSAFSARWRCIAPDLVGFGRSEKPDRDYSVEAYADWLGRFLDVLGVRRAPIVGHSMGGTIALLFALKHPERVERLCVVNPLIQGSTALKGQVKCLTLPVVRDLVRLAARWRWMRRYVTKNFSYVQRIDDAMAEDVIRGTRRSMFDSMRSLMAIDLVPRLGDLRVPTLAIGSDRDLVVTPGQHALIPSARKETIPESGHMPMIERPAEFNRLLDAFLHEAS